MNQLSCGLGRSNTLHLKVHRMGANFYMYEKIGRYIAGGQTYQNCRIAAALMYIEKFCGTNVLLFAANYFYRLGYTQITRCQMAALIFVAANFLHDTCAIDQLLYYNFALLPEILHLQVRQTICELDYDFFVDPDALKTMRELVGELE